MPTINPSLIPTKTPGTLFSALTGGDTSLNVRWLIGSEPVYYEVINRPLADVVVRQLVIAKAVDTLEARLGHQVLFPFLVQPQVTSGTVELDVPIGLIWDMHASLPKKWEKLRLSKIKRISGTNGTYYTGKLRLVFSANVIGSSTEASIFYADYQIDSLLTFQPQRLIVATLADESNAISHDESETVAGYIIFNTLDTSLTNVSDLFILLAPPVDTTDSNTDGLYDNPAIYEISDSTAGGIATTDDYALLPLSHGTGILTDSAWSVIPQLDSDINSWLSSFNYPFDSTANRTSVDSIVIPATLFREFDICAPAGDRPTGDTSGLSFPVWISRIERIGSGDDQLRFYFATFNVTDSDAGGSPSTTPIEFATLDLLRSFAGGEIVEIVPIKDLKLSTDTIAESEQGFGRGHVVLSNLWDRTSSIVDDFFNLFASIVISPADTEFSQSSTRISSFGVSRVPKYVPTVGQSKALIGSTSRLNVPIPPSYDNRFVTEQDQGLGNQIDLESQSGITPHTAIDRYGYSGALCHKLIYLVVDASNLGSDPNFYDTHILPRLTTLLGRSPQFGDEWFDGVRKKFYSGDAWLS